MDQFSSSVLSEDEAAVEGKGSGTKRNHGKMDNEEEVEEEEWDEDEYPQEYVEDYPDLVPVAPVVAVCTTNPY